jgi:3-hydroxybutyryl-CoA dehydrogenase
VVVGAGFGGLFATRRLRNAPVEVTLIDRTTHHLFQPLLYQVATGILSEGDVAPAVRDVLRRQRNARVLLGEVVDIDPHARPPTSEGKRDMTYSRPSDIDRRPIAIDGAGTLGRRIAAVYAAGGSDVRIFDMSAQQRDAASDYVERHIEQTQEVLKLRPKAVGQVQTADSLEGAVAGAWMVIEAVPEKLELKTTVFADLDRLTEPDVILATNSSSLPSSQMISQVRHPERVLNTHYQQPPELNSVELMSCGKTDEGVIDALAEVIPRYGLAVFRVRRESDGFIFNRIWASIKRECLMVVQEGVADPDDVDEMWRIFTRPGIPPFRLMDRVGLDVVLNIEEHYAQVREGVPEGPRQLLHDYISQGRLGVKSGRGFYDYAERA